MLLFMNEHNDHSTGKRKRVSHTAIVPLQVSNRRAGKDPQLELLFYWLERFVNLADDLKAFQGLAEECPDFLPVRFYDANRKEEAQKHPVGWQPDFHELFRVFRDMLREVWERGSNSELAVLLGTDGTSTEIINREAPPSVLHAVLGGYQASLRMAVSGIPKGYFVLPNKILPDWRLGIFRYAADTDFRRAVYELFRQSWRAKVCPKCEKFFVANKPPQRYCSTTCYGAAKRDRDLEFWRNVGSNLRKKRSTKETKR